MSLLEGFRFRKKDSPIHNLDPRAKGVYLVLSLIAALMFTEVVPMLLVFSASIVLVALAGCTREWGRSMRGIAVFTILIFALNLISVPENRVNYAVAMVLRFLALTSSFSVFFLTTTPDDFMAALEKLGIPKEYTLMFTMSLRFIPTLARDLQIIADSQKSRGLELEKGSFIQKIRNYVPILVPLMVYEIRRSIMVAEALEARAFGAARRSSPYVGLSMGKRDYAFLALTSLAFGALIFAKLANYMPWWMELRLPEI